MVDVNYRILEFIQANEQATLGAFVFWHSPKILYFYWRLNEDQILSRFLHLFFASFSKKMYARQKSEWNKAKQEAVRSLIENQNERTVL